MQTSLQIRSDRPEPEIPDEAYDSRFRRLIPAAGWLALEPAIRARFTKRLRGPCVAVYRGEILETRLSRIGWMLSQLCRLIGAPLPLFRDRNVAAVVIVSEDEATGGQRWTRIYHRFGNNPQVINSAKAFGGPTGLEEHVGGRIGMALRVEAASNCLTFLSDHYFVRIGPRRVRLPAWFGPGVTKVTHRDLGGGRFAFDLNLCHHFLGEIIHQHAIFRDE